MSLKQAFAHRTNGHHISIRLYVNGSENSEPAEQFLSRFVNQIMSEGSEIVLFLQCLNDVCPEYAEKKCVPSILFRIFGPHSAESMKRAVWFLANNEPFSMFCHAIFNSEIGANAVEVLQKNGYYLNGNPALMKEIETKFDPRAISNFLECLMWAYLDRNVPRKSLSKLIGNSRSQACVDAESACCMWINTSIKKHSKLPPISTITSHFFGKPHFRVALFNYLHQDILLDVSDDPNNNAEVGLTRAFEAGLQAPFSHKNYQQPPLVIMCYLLRCISLLSEMQQPKPRPVVSAVEMTTMLKNIEQKKKEITETTSRVVRLSDEISEISEILRTMKRPVSHLARTMPQGAVTHDARPQTSLAATSASNRVTWEIPEGALQRSLEERELAAHGDETETIQKEEEEINETE